MLINTRGKNNKSRIHKIVPKTFFFTTTWDSGQMKKIDGGFQTVKAKA